MQGCPRSGWSDWYKILCNWIWPEATDIHHSSTCYYMPCMHTWGLLAKPIANLFIPNLVKTFLKLNVPQVIEETLRHHPPMLSLPKESAADKELVLSGYSIPTKSRLVVRTDRDFKVQLALFAMAHMHIHTVMSLHHSPYTGGVWKSMDVWS